MIGSGPHDGPHPHPAFSPVLAWRAAARAPTPWAVGAGLAVVCGLLTLAGEWASLGIVAGIPLQAATCLLFGLAAAGAAAARDADG